MRWSSPSSRAGTRPRSCTAPPDRSKARRMTDHFDALETRDPDAARARRCWPRCRRRSRRAQAHAPAFARAASPTSTPAAVTTPRRARAAAGDRASPSCSSASRRRARSVRRLLGHRAGAQVRGACSSRPARSTSPRGARPTTGASRARLFAAGFRAGDLVHNSFSYHLTPAGSMMETGAHAIGCTVFPGGVGQHRAAAAGDRRPAPRRLRRHAALPAHPAREGRRDAACRCRSLRKALVGGEAFPPTLRDWLRARGIEGYQAYATADVGLIAYETAAREGLVRRRRRARRDRAPRHRRPGARGEVGEVVVTVLPTPTTR